MGVLPVQCIVLRTRTEYISNDGDGLCAKSSSSWGLNEVTSGFHEVYLVQRDSEGSTRFLKIIT